MGAKQTVTLKGSKDGIIIMLDESAGFDAIKQNLKTKVAQGKQFFGNTRTVVIFQGRELSDYEAKQLTDIIIAETNLEIDFVIDKAIPSPPPPKDKPNIPPVPAITPLPAKTTTGRENITKYYQGGLRSGQSVHFGGSVVIMGDVNPGSEVVADGNVIVLGSLKGLAHAGAGGDSTCFVYALVMQPTQLRIATIISNVPQTPKNARSADYAYIKDGQVFVGPTIK